MDIMQKFLGYAGDFEKTLADDDWTRLGHYFADDAVYEVKAESFGCRLVGPTAIFRGMKKSLDGFDRKFAKRDIEVTCGPEVSGDGLRLGWKVVYSKGGSRLSSCAAVRKSDTSATRSPISRTFTTRASKRSSMLGSARTTSGSTRPTPDTFGA